MFPGLTTRMSEEALSLTTTISPKSDLVRVTSTATTTVLAQITPPFGGQAGVLLIVNASGNNITTVTTGNIIVARTIPVNMPIVLTWSQSAGKWYVGAIS